ESPRKRVPAGSVGIGGDQTGVYPFETPGGWNLIGRTPITLFQFDEQAHAVIEPGDRVRFVAIGARDFQLLRDKR
ncbi:carboxyltransferase domain-containing protein, partial [Xanthomonas citri pv. citri]|nr:carboxyltransferase domain-containing protein [Xanthomonas citri pv. citri]